MNKTALSALGVLILATTLGQKTLALEAQGGVVKQVPLAYVSGGDGKLFSPHALIVDKSKKKLYLFEQQTAGPVLIDTFEADLGKASGDKTSAGDHRTPEGVYFLTDRLEGDRLDPFQKTAKAAWGFTYGVMAFVTDYPNYFDRRDSKTGSGIWLHAIDDNISLERGSRGCVVVRNETIKKLAPYIRLNETPIMIFDKVDWVEPAAHHLKHDQILSFLDKWRRSWESKDLDNYMSNYSEEFRSLGLNRTGWRKFKSNLANRYDEIHVRLSQPVVFEHQKIAIVRFYQDYQSTGLKDFGLKTLYIKKVGGEYSIIGEEWQAAKDAENTRQLAISTPCCETRAN